MCAAICSLARPWEAILIGAIGALLACPGCALLDKLRIDDPVGCVPTHCFAGIWGLVSVALFTEKDTLENKFSNEYGILKGGPWSFLGVQLLMVVAVAAWAATTTFVELLLVDKVLGLRMSVEHELLGADKVEHGIVEHDLISQANNDVKVNGRPEQIRSSEINVDGLQRNEEFSALQRNENTDKSFWKTIRARRKLLRPKWRKAVTFNGARSEGLRNGSFVSQGFHVTGSVSVDLEAVTKRHEHVSTQENGNAITEQSVNGLQVG